VLKKTLNTEEKLMVILMIAMMAGFASDSLFSFPEERIEHMLYLTTGGGIILGLYFRQFQVSPKGRETFPRSIAALLILVAGFNVFIGWKKYKFNKHMGLAKAYDKVEGYNEVLKEVKKGANNFVTLDADGKPLEMYACIALKSLQRYDEALTEGKKAKNYHPNSFMIYNNIGTIYTEMKQYESAVENYKHALKLAPGSKNIILNLAINYFALKDFENCIQTLEKVNFKNDPYLMDIYNASKTQLSHHPQMSE
jgi:tetratricopeptide (TPR) repeat protein